MAGIGGYAALDIGRYPIAVARCVFAAEPPRTSSRLALERQSGDPHIRSAGRLCKGSAIDGRFCQRTLR